MIEHIILSYSDEGDIIFDPFLGSGTILSVAMVNNKNRIGFEVIDKNLF